MPEAGRGKRVRDADEEADMQAEPGASSSSGLMAEEHLDSDLAAGSTPAAPDASSEAHDVSSLLFTIALDCGADTVKVIDQVQSMCRMVGHAFSGICRDVATFANAGGGDLTAESPWAAALKPPMALKSLTPHLDFSVWSHSAKGLLTMRPCDHLGAHGALIPVGDGTLGTLDRTVGSLESTVGSLEGIVRRRSIRFLSSLSEAPFECPFAALVILNALASGRHKGLGKLERGLGPWGCCERAVVCVLGPKSAPELTCEIVQSRTAPTVLILTCGDAATRIHSIANDNLRCLSKPIGPGKCTYVSAVGKDKSRTGPRLQRDPRSEDNSHPRSKQLASTERAIRSDKSLDERVALVMDWTIDNAQKAFARIESEEMAKRVRFKEPCGRRVALEYLGRIPRDCPSGNYVCPTGLPSRWRDKKARLDETETFLLRADDGSLRGARPSSRWGIVAGKPRKPMSRGTVKPCSGFPVAAGPGMCVGSPFAESSSTPGLFSIRFPGGTSDPVRTLYALDVQTCRLAGTLRRQAELGETAFAELCGTLEDARALDPGGSCCKPCKDPLSDGRWGSLLLKPR